MKKILYLKSYILNLSLSEEGFIKFSRRSLSLILVVAIIIPSLSYLFLFKGGQASAAWFDDSWTYRQRVDITNTGSNQTDYQVSITLDTATLITAGKVQSDCDDLRITDTNGKLLPHWIEESNPGCNSATTKIWTKAPSITTSGATVYLYYGNPSASNVENPTQVFVFYDNFSGDLSRWTIPSGCTSTISSGVLQITANTTCDSTPMYVTNLTQSDASGYAFDFRGKFSGGSGRLQSYQRYRSTNTHMARYWISGANTYYEEANPGFGSGSDIGTSSMSTDTWYNLSSKVAGSSNNWVVNGTTIGTSTTVAATLLTQTDLTVGLGQYNTTVQYDNVRVRKSATTEPAIASPTNEEKGTAPVAYWKFDEGNGVVANNSQFKSNGTMTNLSTNPSFETNTTGWAQVQTTATRQSSASPGAPFGSYSVSTVFTTQGGSGWRYSIASGIAASTAYVVSGWFKTTSATCTLLFVVNETSGQGVYSTAITATGGTWQRFTVTGTTDSDATGSGYIDAPRCNGAETVEVDGVQLETGSSATNYCDGSLTGNGTHTWTGTAHASTSTCTNGTDGMISGATWQTEDQCIAGKCLKFDGTDDYVAGPSGASTAVSITGDLSISAWIKTSDTVAGIVDFGSNSTGAGYLFMLGSGGCSAGILSFETAGGGWDCGSTAVNDNQWHQIGVTLSGTTLTYYIDGRSDGTDTSASPTSWSGARAIGAANDGAGGSGTLLGHIDEVKVYNFALSAAQVKANYAAKASGDGASAVLGSSPSQNLSNGLVGYWKMDEASANTCTGGVNDSCDSSGNANNGAWNGDATATTGKFGNGVTFDATTDYINAGNSSTLTSATTWTASAWVYPTNVSGYREVLGGVYSATNATVYINAGTVGVYTNGDYFTTATITASTWSHIAITEDGTSLRIYINGALSRTFTNAFSFGPGSGNMTIGINPSTLNTEGFLGSIDEARVYNRALSPDEITQLYNFAPGPVAFWNFEEGSGSNTVDKANGLSGVITGATFQPGKYGKGLKFDGTDDVVTVTDPGANSVLDMNGQITMNAWFKTSATNDYSGLMVKSDSASHGYQINMQTSGNAGGYLYNGTTTNGNIDTSANYEDGNWHYISMTYDGSASKVYVDGVQKTNSTGLTGYLGSASNDNSNLLIGNDGCCGSRFFNGTLDEVKIYNYARNSKQIVEDMNAGHPSVGSPVGSAGFHLKLDEGADNTCSGGTNDACNSGSQGSALDGAKTGATWSQDGKFGRALLSDGGDYVTSPDSTYWDFGTNDFSISMWTYITSIDTNGTFLMFQQSGAGAGGFEWYINTSSSMLFNPNSAVNIITKTIDSPLNAWHHFVVTRSGTTFTIYQNGVSKGTTTSSTAVDNVSGVVKIGAYTDSTYDLLGRFDEPKIYNYALTASEIKLDMNRGQAQLLGATSDNSSYALNAANQEYCVPGDSTSCVAPIARWDFNEGGSSTTTSDTSGNGNTGTITVGASGSQTTASQLWKPGKAGKALNLDGTDDYVTLGSALNVANTMTITGWFFTNDITKRQTLLALHSGGANTGNIEVGAPFGVASGAVGMVQYGVATAANTPSGLYSNGTWVHFAYTRNGAYTTQQFYINGIAVTTTQADLTLSDDAGVGQIGVRTSASQFFTGSVDNLRVYNYARTGAQIAWDYNRGGPVGHWRFDECQGTTLNDSAGNSNTLITKIGGTGTQTAVGTCTGSANTAWKDGVAGKRNYSLDFDGTDDYLCTGSGTTCASDSDFDMGSNISFGGWFKTSSTARQAIISRYGGEGSVTNAWYSLEVAITTGYINLRFRDDTDGTLQDLAGTTNLADGNWHHAMAVRNGTSIYIYIDGVQVNTTTLTETGAYTFDDPFIVGMVGVANTAPFAGQLDDTRVYKYALSATQVKMLYTGFTTFYGPSTGAP